MSTDTKETATSHGAEHGHGDAHGAHDEEPFHVHAHISSFGFLAAIFATLIVLTFITVAVSYVDLGPANLFVAVTVATIKASLVSIFFMHLKYDRPLNSLIFVGSFVFLGVFIGLTFNDIGTRAELDRDNMNTTYARNGQAAPGGLPDSPINMGSAHGHGEGHGEGHAEGHAPAGEHH